MVQKTFSTEVKTMKEKDLGKIQLIIAVVVAVYAAMPDMVIGPVDDVAIATIAGIVEVVLAVMRSFSNSDPDRMTKDY